jgi:PAS domain S-box-containing protein
MTKSEAREVPALATSFSSASNEMLAAILDQSTDCIKVIGPEGRLDFMNRNGRCAMGIDDFDSVAGKNWWDLWPAESRDIVRNSIATARDEGSARFEAFCPTAKGEPRWWDVSVSPLRDAQGELRGLISISRDVSNDVRAREIFQTAAAEMKHRLRNAYALTSAIVMMSARGDERNRAFAQQVTRRFEQLGIAQALLLDASVLGTPTLTLLVERLTTPFCSDPEMIEASGLPAVTLNEEQVRTLALVLGEFSTNSNKYGALGHGGKIIVSGEVRAGTLTLHWRERSDQPVADGPRDGSSGLGLIRRALAAQGGSLDAGFHADGVDLTVALPGFRA